MNINHRSRWFGAWYAYVLLFVLGAVSCRSAIKLTSQSPTVPIETAGRIVDFPQKVKCYQTANGALIGVANDQDQLYIFFNPDLKAHRRLNIKAKLSLWLDQGGENSQRLGFVHEGGYASPDDAATHDPGPEELERGEQEKAEFRRLLGAALNELGLTSGQITVIEPGRHRQERIPADGSQGVMLDFSDNWGDYTYVWRIPLKPEGQHPGWFINAAPGQTIGIHLVWQTFPILTLTKRPAADRPRGGMSGMSGMANGGGPEQMGPLPGLFPDQMNQKKQYWLKVRLK